MGLLQSKFTEMYSEFLAPLGYVRLKTKKPYFARAVNDDVIHIINCGCIEDIPLPLEDEEGWFVIWGGAATLYQKELAKNLAGSDDFVPTMKKLCAFFRDSADFHPDDMEFYKSISIFTYIQNDTESIADALEYSAELTEEFVLPALDNIRTIEACVNFFDTLRIFGFDRHEAGFDLHNNFNEEYAFVKTRSKGFPECIASVMKIENRESEKYKFYEKLRSAFDDEQEYDKLSAEMERLKSENREDLRKLGLDI